jgi:hypothetical protein
MENQTVQTLLYYNAGNQLSDPVNHDVNGCQFEDWRFPTKREFAVMYGVTSSSDWWWLLNYYYYWTSAQVDLNNIWVFDAYQGNQGNGSKDDLSFVRAVRAFNYLVIYQFN